MGLSRRRFFQSGALIAMTSAASSLDVVEQPATVARASAPVAVTDTPTIGVIALNRIAYGPRLGDIDRVNTIGLQAYVDEQLSPVDSDDPANAKIAAATLHIEYNATPPVKEERPLQRLNATLPDLWALTTGALKGTTTELQRSADEVRAATWLRAVYSKWQLREVLVEFWHNHFNVDAYQDNRTAAIWPVYDRDVIRKNCFGNFRTLLGDVAKSTPMLYYLDNALSKDGPANENYARELFELHTLGRPHYLNEFYDRWRDVPGALDGKPVGYIDEDVYEAARAMTGWTVADGRDFGGGDKQNTGAFKYVNAWHDNAQKRVLATEFPPNQVPLADGEQVLSLVAAHPGTANYLCTKLCRRLVSDTPPDALVQAATDVWVANQSAPDQIKQVVRFIVLSPEFAATWGQKVKRPFELIASFLRITEADVTPNFTLFNWLPEMGYRMFNWPTPTGHPDTSTDWLSTNITLRRWNIMNSLFTTTFGAATFDLVAKTPAGATSRQIVDFWVARVLGRALPASSVTPLVDLTRQDAGPDVPPIGNADDLRARINSLVALIAMTPEFQQR